MLGIILFIYNHVKEYHHNTRYKWISRVISVIYAATVILAEYELFTTCGKLLGIVFALSVFVIAYIGAVSVCIFIRNKWSDIHWEYKECGKKDSIKVFLVVLIIICLIDGSYLLSYVFPGALNADSLWQIQQATDHSYFNHHPFWHTMIIRFCLKAGKHIWGTGNGGILVYSIIQIVMMACVIAYTYVTVYQMNVRPWLRRCILLWYIMMPFHIAYSGTVWKDVYFGCMVLVFITSLIRIIYGIDGFPHLNYVLFGVGTVGFIVFRSNGWIALVMALVVYILLYRKNLKRVILIMAALLIVIKSINIPVFKHFNVTETDIVESISIPAQQIGRVYVDGGDVSPEEEAILKKVVDTEKLAEVYTCYISDPIKEIIFSKGNTEYIVDNKWDYIGVWLSIGIKNPQSYIHAWVDQTKGYWNVRQDARELWRIAITENEYGIYRDIQWDALSGFWETYLSLFENLRILKPFISIGLYVWILIFLGAMKMRDCSLRLAPFIPIFAIWGTLLIATPVDGVLRYMYSFVICVPIIAVSIFCKMSQRDGKKEICTREDN